MFYSKAYFYFALALAVVLAGFFNSYFARLGDTDLAHHFHGITATLWMLLLIVQAYLYARRLFHWHRILGWISVLLVPTVVIGGLSMVDIMLERQDDYPPLLPYQLAYIDFYTLSIFLVFVILALQKRKQTQEHARYMACTVFGPMIPALTRLFFRTGMVDSFQFALHLSFLLVECVILVLLLDDRSKGRIRPPYVVAVILFLILHLTMTFASGWDWWRSLMDVYSEWWI